MTRLQTRPSDRISVLSTFFRQIQGDALLTSAEERALARYIAARATRTPRLATPARATSPTRKSA